MEQTVLVSKPSSCLQNFRAHWLIPDTFKREANVSENVNASSFWKIEEQNQLKYVACPEQASNGIRELQGNKTLQDLCLP